MSPQAQAVGRFFVSTPDSAADPRLALVGDGGELQPEEAAMATRLREVVGDQTYKEVARRTGSHPETVRRYFLSGRPNVTFIGAFCAAYGVCADWLLDGSGQMRRDIRPVHAARVQDEPPAGSPPDCSPAPPRPARISGRARKLARS